MPVDLEMGSILGDRNSLSFLDDTGYTTSLLNGWSRLCWSFPWSSPCSGWMGEYDNFLYTTAWIPLHLNSVCSTAVLVPLHRIL